MTNLMDEKLAKMEKYSKIVKIQVLGSYEREVEKNKRLKPIYDSFSKSSHVEEVYEIGETYQIAKVTENFNGEEETLYMPFVNYKKSNTYYNSLEGAMIGAIALKNDKENAVKFICDGLGVIPEKDREQENK